MAVQFRITTAILVLVLQCAMADAQEKPRIFLGASSKTLGYSPLWVASRKGFFDQQGLDVAPHRWIVWAAGSQNCQVERFRSVAVFARSLPADWLAW